MELLVHQGEHDPLEGVREPKMHLQILPLPEGEGDETGCTCMQSQIMCHHCRRVLAYPSGAPSVCGAMCRAITAVPPPAPGAPGLQNLKFETI
ncbi:protein LSD1 [Triticum aestivum]|uniref:protein LSD1 n=1 Tax=Triticum aestivum TaxID=4565 RepID=UPI0008454B49|nr:protein LSD1-like [Triticum aestivum]